MRGSRNAHRPEALAKTRSNSDVHGLRRIWQMSAVPRQGDLRSIGVRRRCQQVSRRRCFDISSSLGCVYTVVVGASRLRPSSLHHGDSTAVGVGDVVETKKLPRTPTNQRASDLIDHGLDLDVASRDRRGNEKEESVADFLGLEVGSGPRNEFGQRDGSGLAHVYEDSLSGGGSSSR
jgi:hypothetical protein